jgi:A/G-specific adenine glycosylase
MLQQTQVGRVVPKYELFLRQFPTVGELAAAPLSKVLVAWQGLGYNRRAQFLWRAAQQIVDQFAGMVPQAAAELVRLPGIGTNTAGAIVAYAYNQPAVFIETNIRTVYIHHFFGDQTGVTDDAITELLTQTLEYDNPRQFYWALMDYGTHLKVSGVKNVQQSKHFTKQSRFEGSVRQLRGRALRLLAERPRPAAELLAELGDERSQQVLAQLVKEGLIAQAGQSYRLA